MIEARERRCPLQCPEISNFFDNTNCRGVTLYIGADGARIYGIKITAGRTGLNMLRRRLHRNTKRLQEPLSVFDEMQSGAPG